VNLFKEHLIYEQSTARGLLLLATTYRITAIYRRREHRKSSNPLPPARDSAVRSLLI
jgi:hypothetical protein